MQIKQTRCRYSDWAQAAQQLDPNYIVWERTCQATHRGETEVCGSRLSCNESRKTGEVRGGFDCDVATEASLRRYLRKIRGEGEELVHQLVIVKRRRAVQCGATGRLRFSKHPEAVTCVECGA